MSRVHEREPGRNTRLGAVAWAAALLFASTSAQGQTVELSFEGVSQYDGASFGRNFLPPDPSGAAGLTQYLEAAAGAFAVFDKGTGTQLSVDSDLAFWSAAGQTGANGDARVRYNAAANRWVVTSFGDSAKDVQIAVSDTGDALGGWKSIRFEGYAGVNSVADYPTLALDRYAVYISTNNFAPGLLSTTLNVIPIDSLFGAGAPTLNNMKRFVTPASEDRGFALQGVNTSAAGSTGTVVASSLFEVDNVAFKVDGLNASSAISSTLTDPVYLMMAAYASPGDARQPAAAVPANRRIIDTSDERIGSSAYEAQGKIFMVQTVDSIADGLDETRVRYTVIDATTLALLDEGDIGEAGFDYYQGSIAVNSLGQAVIGYNRSGLAQTDGNGDGLSDGNISLMARTFAADASGQLQPTSGELLLKVSPTDDYHNGSLFGAVYSGRQRWGDSSQVSVDPSDESKFWVVGQFAREYDLPQFGHPDGLGRSRWGTWIARIAIPIDPDDDSDGDGAPNATDNCPIAANPAQLDADADTVGDACDNCSQRANADQRNTNGDQYGNVCDPDYNDDGAVGIPDFNLLRTQFGKRSDINRDFNPNVDHNGDGVIGLPDFNVLRSYFGGAPGPAGALQ